MISLWAIIKAIFIQNFQQSISFVTDQSYKLNLALHL